MLNFLLLLAKSSVSTGTEGKGMSGPVAIVLFLIAIGLGITLSPPKRTSEIKKSKEE